MADNNTLTKVVHKLMKDLGHDEWPYNRDEPIKFELVNDGIGLSFANGLSIGWACTLTALVKNLEVLDIQGAFAEYDIILTEEGTPYSIVDYTYGGRPIPRKIEIGEDGKYKLGFFKP